MSSSRRDSTPLDVVRRVAQYLDDDQACSTLASLTLSCKGAYHLLTPILYRTLVIDGTTSDNLIDLSLLEDGMVDMEELLSIDEAFFEVNNPVRRLVAWGHVQQLVIRSFPSERQSKRFLTVARTLSGSPITTTTVRNRLFPKLDTLRLLPDAVDAIRTYMPEEYDRPHNPPFLEGLVLTSRPSRLCMAFPVVPSARWEEYRDRTATGAYKLVLRISQLGLDGWDSLKSLDVHDLVHQVLPSLSGCVNTYHFTPHLVGQEWQSGQEGTGTPGPQWNFRAWQLSTSIKNIFPSGTDAHQALKGSSWRFVNASGHVISKMVRDDDDETGVGYDEVDRLIRGAMKAGLPQDLPMRDGFGAELVDEVFDKISYVDEQEVCQCCGRSGCNQATILDLGKG